MILGILSLSDRIGYFESCTTLQIEDEFHFVLQCPKYVQLKKKYLNAY